MATVTGLLVAIPAMFAYNFMVASYLAAIPLAFDSLWIAMGWYLFVALMWLVPYRGIERALTNRELE